MLDGRSWSGVTSDATARVNDGGRPMAEDRGSGKAGLSRRRFDRAAGRPNGPPSASLAAVDLVARGPWVPGMRGGAGLA